MKRNILPTAFSTPEQALLDKFIEVQKTLIDRTDITPRDQVEIRRILSQSQRSLAALAKKHLHSHVLLHFHRDVHQFVRQVDDMQMMLRQTLTDLHDSKSQPAAEDEATSPSLNNPDSEPASHKTLRELCLTLSMEDKLKFGTNCNELLDRIQHIGLLSTAVYNISLRFDENSRNHDLLDRFEALEVIVEQTINDINDVIDGPEENLIEAPENDAASAQSDSDSSSTEETDSVEDTEKEKYDDFGFYALHVCMQKQAMALIKTFNEASERRVDMLKLISRLGGKEPSPASSRESSTSSSSSSSSSGYSSLFSRSRNPDQKNQSNHSSTAGPGI